MFLPKMCCAAAAASVALFAASSAFAASHVVTGQITNDGVSTTVDYWGFSVSAMGQVTIDTLSMYWDPDSDGVSHYMDPYIYLFTDDGALDASDFISANDDSGSTYADGSVHNYDSWMQLNLAAGDYVLAISNFSLSLNDAVDGTNASIYYPYVQAGGQIHTYGSSACLTIYDCSYADYQITFTGDDITVPMSRIVTPDVPLPAAAPLLAAALAGVAVLRRRA